MPNADAPVTPAPTNTTVADPADPPKELPADAVPADYDKKTDTEKLAWLKTQRFDDEHKTTPRASAYLKGVDITHYLGIFAKAFLKPLSIKLKMGDQSSNAVKAGKAFIKAYSDGIGKFNDAMCDDLDKLLKTGLVPHDSVVMAPERAPKFDDLDEKIAAGATSKDMTQGIWDAFASILEVVISKNEKLNTMGPGGVSWAKLLQGFIDAGHAFYTQWTKDPKVLDAPHVEAPVSTPAPPAPTPGQDNVPQPVRAPSLPTMEE